MYVLIRHKIADPETFWPLLEAIMTQTPPHLKFSCSYPGVDRHHGICLWQGETIAAVREFVEAKLGHVSVNDYFQVDEEKATCLPRQSRKAAANGPAGV